MEVLRRGTTPTLTFKIPYSASDVADGWVTFKQYDSIMLDKRITDDGVTINDNSIEVALTQDETLKLYASVCMVQLRLKLANGNAVASGIVSVDIGEIIKDGEI